MPGKNPKNSNRFARVFEDGSMGLERAGTDLIEARRRLCEGHDDPDVELIEVQVTVIRTHGKPKLRVVGNVFVTCPTCGEEIHAAEAQEEIERLRAELDAAVAANMP